MNFEFTYKKPTKPGFYYWTNFKSGSPAVLQVTKIDNRLYASAGDFSFKLAEASTDEMWAGPIPLPTLNGKIVKPDSF